MWSYWMGFELFREWYKIIRGWFMVYIVVVKDNGMSNGVFWL